MCRYIIKEFTCPYCDGHIRIRFKPTNITLRNILATADIQHSIPYCKEYDRAYYDDEEARRDYTAKIAVLLLKSTSN